MLFEWMKLQRWPAYIMFGLIASVGLINVLSALSMIIIEKSTQIGILKAQGMENIILRFIFIIGVHYQSIWQLFWRNHCLNNNSSSNQIYALTYTF